MQGDCVMPIQKDMLPRWWPLARPEVKRALSRTEDLRTPESVYRLLETGDLQMFVILRNAEPSLWVLTHIYDAPAAKVGSFFLVAGGDLPENLLEIDYWHGWFRRNGCGYVEISGRTGWARALKPHGYELITVNLRKKL